MRKNKRAMVQKPEPEDLRMKTAITAEEVRGLAAQVQVGDKIRWDVLDTDISSPKGYRTKKITLTVTRKSRYLLEAADSRGRIYSIRYVELAEARRKERARLKEMNRSARRTAG